MKYKTEYVITGNFEDTAYVLHDTYYGVHCIEGEIDLPFEIKDGAKYFKGALKVEETGIKSSEVTDEDFGARSASGRYECLHTAYLLLSVTTEAETKDEAMEHAEDLVDEFLGIEDLRLDDIDVEEKDTTEVTATEAGEM